MEIGEHWKDALWKSAGEIMKRGGKLEMVVIVQGRDRIAVIHKYPDNRIVCKKETLID